MVKECGIKNTDSIGYANLLKIIFNNKCINMILSDESSLNYTFTDVLNEAYKNGYYEGVITLIAESPLDGKVYEYGNYGLYWVRHGETRGYA